MLNSLVLLKRRPKYCKNILLVNDVDDDLSQVLVLMLMSTVLARHEHQVTDVKETDVYLSLKYILSKHFPDPYSFDA